MHRWFHASQAAIAQAGDHDATLATLTAEFVWELKSSRFHRKFRLSCFNFRFRMEVA